MLFNVPLELILVIVLFTIVQFSIARRAQLRADQVESKLRSGILQARETLDQALTRPIHAQPPEQPLIRSIVRSSRLRKSPLSIQETSETVDFYFGGDFNIARAAVATLPILGLLATFLGMGIALWSSASAQGELSRTLSNSDIPAEQAAAPQQPSEARFELDVGTLRAQLKEEMDHSTEGLRRFVEQQQRSLAGMGIAVTASIIGICLSLLLQVRVRGVESTRTLLINDLFELSGIIANAAQSKAANLEELTSDELLKRLILQLDVFMVRVESSEKAASLTADTSSQMLQHVHRLVSEVSTLASQSKATDSSAREMLDSASQAVTALTPVASAATRILDGLGQNVTELQDHISAQVGLLQSSSRTAKESVAQIESATRLTVTATNDLRSTIEELREVRSSFESKSTDVTGRVDKLIVDHRSINGPVVDQMKEVSKEMQRVDARMRRIESIAADSTLSPAKVIVAVVVVGAIAWGIGAYMRLAEKPIAPPTSSGSGTTPP